jgi:hypothetical protein
MRTLMFVPAVGLVAALFGSPSVASREASPGIGERTVQFTSNGKPAGSSDRCDDRHGLADSAAEGSGVEFTRIEWKSGE